MKDMIKVGMADMKLCEPPDTITTVGLGSCVGLVLYDLRTKLCGMIHIMLPDSTKIKNNANRAKFADTAINDMIENMKKKGSVKHNIVAKIAGGAQMFGFGGDKMDSMRVGEKNVEAVKSNLSKYGIRILAEDTGLNYGRTIIFEPATGKLIIHTVGKSEKVI